MSKLIEEKPVIEKPKTKKVVFDKEWQGSLNNYKIVISKKDVLKGTAIRELPIVVYDWIQKYKVCRDA